MAPPDRVLTTGEKRALFDEGYLVVKGAVGPDLVEAARARIVRAERGEDLSDAVEMTNLVNASSLTPVLHDAMGRFDSVTQAQIGVVERTEPGDRFNSLGYIDRDMPYYGAQLHMDGNITINRPPHEVFEGSAEEIYRRYLEMGPKGDIGRCAEVMGDNFTPLFQDPAMTLALGSFTTFCFVCLSDQTRPGCGQTSLLPGGHFASERFFRWQYQTSPTNHIGPEGSGWPRLDHDVPNRCGMRYLPDAILDEFTDETSATTSDGRRWPEPVQVLMEPGDACIAMYNIPHSGSRNAHGTESRKNIIFRIRNKRRQPDKVLTGRSDHPDRGWLGEWLDYEDGNDPWERSKQAMMNMWAEWEGLPARSLGT